MKTLKPLFTTICLIFIFTSSLKAQDEDCPVCGWYVDGVKVEKIDCYNFDKLTIVLPYNSGMNGYDKVNLWFSYNVPLTGLMGGGTKMGVKPVPGNAIKTLVKGDYVVYSFFEKNNKRESGLVRGINGSVDDNYFAYILYSDISKKQKKDYKDGRTLVCQIEGATVSEIKEEYDAASGTIKKIPHYSETKLTKAYTLILGNNLIEDASQVCTYTGSKVDFNKLGGGSNNNGSGNVTINNTVVVKNEIKTTGGNTSNGSASGKTIITASAVKTQAQLKPLDKTKPGYFEEKDGGKITRAGYKKGDDYLGEVREYNTNGTVNEVSIYTNGVQDGLHLKFDDDGKLSLSGNYKNGNQDGTWQWFSNGTLEKTTKYVNGQEQ